MNKQKQVVALYPNAICKRKRWPNGTRWWRIYLHGRKGAYDGCGSNISSKEAWSSTLNLINSAILRAFSA